MDSATKIKPIEKIIEVNEPFSFTIFHRFGIAIVLASLLTWILPHESIAFEGHERLGPVMYFEVGDHTEFIASIEEEASFKHRHETAVAKLKKQLKMNEALKNYLISKRSPLAEYSHIILQQNNWKKILALSNAESTMCRFYIEEFANCWGVGGSDLWDMGANLGEGVVAMNDFLNTAPYRSPIKYSKMNFEQMNGLYKQPARDHWVYNNLDVYNDLTALERSIK